MIHKSVLQKALDTPVSNEKLAMYIIGELEGQLRQRLNKLMQDEDFRQKHLKSGFRWASCGAGNEETLRVCKAHFEPFGYKVELDYASGTYLE